MKPKINFYLKDDFTYNKKNLEDFACKILGLNFLGIGTDGQPCVRN